jgi:hypothetical protein
MKDSRKGESLWAEWGGEGFETASSDPQVFYTHDHVDLEIEVIRRALASCLQRDGVAITLADGFRALEWSNIHYGYSGFVGGEIYPTLCNEFGETFYGEHVAEVFETTWVEIY